MDFPYRGGEEGYYHQPPYVSRQEEENCRYEEERYPRYTSVYEPAPDGPYPVQYPSHAPGRFAHETPAGPYGTHGPSGPYYPHPQSPPFEALAPEPQWSQPQLPQGQLVRVFCKKNEAFNLAAENDTVIMKPANTQDEAQQWIKDESHGMRVKDNYGHSGFILVNKKTGQILRHAKAKGQQVLLMEYRPDIRDDDILWSESQDFGEGFKTVRCASDTLLNLTVFEGVRTIRTGSPLVLDTWHKGDHQLWKLFPLW